MSRPSIIAKARLSTPTPSFTTGPDPELIVSLKLDNATKPITIAKRSHTNVFNAETAVAVYDITTQKKAAITSIGSIDINYRTAPPLALVPEMADKFITLEPGLDINIVRVPFRPLGTKRRVTRNIAEEDTRDKYRFDGLGMHFLNPGHEYTLGVRDSLRITSWMEGRVNELIQQKREWNPTHDEINIVPDGVFHFKVEE
ncbi:hypothetical protein HJFPF1_09654 [Paramyrothecium foliicola]|nr:hypothetical protein HJFPF1_09654 [Paramyrothecium foliicola]